MANILQASIFTDFLYPFLLMFFIMYALLQKSKLLGADQTQLNAFVSLIVSLIFVSVVFPVMVVNNLVLFMTVGVIVLFVGFVLWGFINNGNITLNGKVLKGMGVLVFVAVIVAVIWATGAFPSVWDGLEKIYDFAFLSNGSENFWTNFLIVALVVAAVAAVLRKKVTAA
ncbi:MAG: hypothetical protein NUV46_02065 [Nanoarchaeota archaeon]|nr:hypothetical protein [Nanoarchaeota archaeon]